MTRRQFAAWREWDERQWNLPDRHDHYLMALIRAVVGGRKPLDDYRIPFVRAGGRDEGQDGKGSSAPSRRGPVDPRADQEDKAALFGGPEALTAVRLSRDGQVLSAKGPQADQFKAGDDYRERRPT